MSYMADRDHIAITNGDTSTTRCRVPVPGCPVALPIIVTQGEYIDTKRRIWSDWGNTVIDVEIRGVSYHCRIVTYQNAPEAGLNITTSSLL